MTPYDQLIEGRRFHSESTPEAKTTARWLFVALLGGPLSLWLSLAFTRTAIRDYSVNLNSHWLVGAAMISASLTVAQMMVPIDRLPTIRKALAIATLLATVSFSFWYAKTTLEAHQAARRSLVERVFLRTSYQSQAFTRSRRVVYSFQRSDGSMVDGSSPEAPPVSGSICAEVQRLDGAHGFIWVRLFGRSQPPAHEIDWPIRAEDCFSNKPLESLQG